MLLIPLIAIQFTSEVNWDSLDFIVAGVLLFGTALAFEFAVRKIHNVRFRIVVCAALIIILFLIWAELAVEIFGTPFAGS